MKTDFRHIVIIGASRGLGAALAIYYAKKFGSELRLTLTATKIEHLSTITIRCQQYGSAVQAAAVDISHADHCMQTLQTSINRTVDIAIINAGISGDTVNGPEDWQQQQKIIHTNLLGAMACSEALLADMQKRQQGRLVFISSIAAHRGFGLTPSYCASKAGLSRYAEGLRGFLKPLGIKVTLVQAGFIDTEMSDAFKGGKPFMVSPAKAAAIIARGIEKNRAQITFPWLVSLYQRILSLLPATVGDKLLQWSGYGNRQY